MAGSHALAALNRNQITGDLELHFNTIETPHKKRHQTSLAVRKLYPSLFFFALTTKENTMV